MIAWRPGPPSDFPRRAGEWTRNVVGDCVRTRACPRGARTAAVGALAMCAVVACAGRDVTRPSPETLVLGKTTYEDVSRRFGPPDRTGTKIVNEQSVRLVSYAFASRVGAPITGGPPPAAYASRVGAPLVEGVTPVAALGLQRALAA